MSGVSGSYGRPSDAANPRRDKQMATTRKTRRTTTAAVKRASTRAAAASTARKRTARKRVVATTRTATARKAVRRAATKGRRAAEALLKRAESLAHQLADRAEKARDAWVRRRAESN